MAQSTMTTALPRILRPPASVTRTVRALSPGSEWMWRVWFDVVVTSAWAVRSRTGSV
jgi:hypothetical protein